MKAQKLGLVLGINMAAACLVMQGCKANKPGKYTHSSPTDQTITVISQPASAPSATPMTEPQEVPEQQITVTQAPAEQAAPVSKPLPSKQSSVATVKPLPAAPSKPSKVKSAAAPAPAAAAAATEEYVVKPGDTLFLISKRTNYRMGAIIAANPGLNPERIRVGQKIKLPGDAAAPAPAVAKSAAPASKAPAKGAKVMQAAAPAPAAANTKAPVKTKNAFVAYEGPTKEYVVKSGDSLGKIAMENGISIRALKALNGLKKDSLRVGQKLKVPSEKQVAAAKKAAAPKKAASKEPAVKDAAASKEPVVKDAAAKAQPAANATVSPAPVELPVATVPAEVKSDEAKPAEAKPAETKPAEATPATEVPPAADAGNAPTYTAKEGDDLVSIAIAFAISPSALMDLNDLKATDEIKPGQVLKLPANVKVNAQ